MADGGGVEIILQDQPAFFDEDMLECMDRDRCEETQAGGYKFRGAEHVHDWNHFWRNGELVTTFEIMRLTGNLSAASSSSALRMTGRSVKLTSLPNA